MHLKTCFHSKHRNLGVLKGTTSCVERDSVTKLSAMTARLLIPLAYRRKRPNVFVWLLQGIDRTSDDRSYEAAWPDGIDTSVLARLTAGLLDTGTNVHDSLETTVPYYYYNNIPHYLVFIKIIQHFVGLLCKIFHALYINILI